MLVGASMPAYSCRVFEAWPKSRLCLRWPALLGRQASFTVHHMPQVMWRRTRSFSVESEEQPGSGSDLATAAWALLGNSALDKAATAPQQKGGRQGVPRVPFRQWSPVAGGNWEAFVRDCLAPKGRAVTGAGLLGHGQQMSQQVCQQLSQQVGQQEGQLGGQLEGQLGDQQWSQQIGHQGVHPRGQQAGHWGLPEVGQQGGLQLGHDQQDASARSSVTSPFHSQVRLSMTHSSHTLLAR